MKISRISVGLAVRAARETARLSLADLAPMAGMTTSSLSRTENGLRALEFAEAVAIAAAVKLDVDRLLQLAEAFERSGAVEKRHSMSQLQQDLNELQQLAIKAAIEAQTS
jgi:transcriptional regulator with XRE-family HTH domain